MADIKVITPENIFEMNEVDKILQIELDYAHAKVDVEKKSVNWKEYWEYYMGFSEPRTQPATGHQLASIFIPKIGEKIDWLTAKIMQAMYNYRPIVNIRANHTDFNQPAKLLEELCDYQFFKIPQIWRKTNDMIKEGCIYNTGVWKVFWSKTLNQPIIDCIPRKNFYPDPHGRYTDECRYAIQRFYKSKEELWANRETAGGVYRDKDLKRLFKNHAPIIEEEGGRQDQQEAQDEALPQSQEGRFEIIEYWTRDGLLTLGLWAKDVKDKAGLVQTEHGMEIIREDKNLLKHGQLPFRCWVFNPKPHEFDGLGMVAMSKDIQDEINTARRQIIDHRSLTIKPETFIPEKALSDTEENKLRQHIAGQVIKYKKNHCGAGDIFPLEIARLQQDAIASVNMADNDLQRRLGIFDHAQGEQFQRKETATTTVSLLQRADLLFANIFQGFAAQVLKPTFEMMVRLNQNFLKGEVQSSHVQLRKQFYTFTKNEIKGDFDFEVNVAAIMGSNEMARQQYMQVWGMFAQNPQLAQMLGIDLEKVAKGIFATFDHIKNPEDMFIKEEMPPQQQPMGMMGQGGGMGMRPPMMGGQGRGLPQMYPQPTTNKMMPF